MGLIDLSFEPPQTRAGRLRRRRRRTLRWGVAVLALALVAVLGVVVVPRLFGCGDGLTELDEECVGVTDGSHVFDPALEEVQAKIKAENDSIARQPYVTVALLLQYTASGNTSIERIRSQVEGAYIAQRAVNQARANPRIKLVLANKGSREQAWKQVVAQLVGMTDAPDHLVAVVGLGVSSRQTADAAKVLSSNGIPMVGAVITADELNSDGSPELGGRIRGLTRVNSTVGDQLTVIAGYLKEHRPELKSALLVNDSNENDLYTSSLSENFREEGRPLADYWKAGGAVIQPYDGTPGTPGVIAQFKTIVGNLCGVNPPDMVFYAGRAALLPDFITGLRSRGCKGDRTITVITGSDASALTTKLPLPKELDAPVSVIFSPLANPAALKDRDANPDLREYSRFEAAFVGDSEFPREDLADGWAVMTHDATLAATEAIQRAAGQRENVPPLPPADVRAILYTMNSATSSISGAAGRFAFHSTRGDATGRRLPVLELTPEGKLRVLGVFDQPVRR